MLEIRVAVLREHKKYVCIFIISYIEKCIIIWTEGVKNRRLRAVVKSHIANENEQANK